MPSKASSPPGASIPGGDPDPAVASITVQAVTDQLVLAFVSGGRAGLSSASTAGTAAVAGSAAGAASHVLVSSAAAYQASTYVSASSYSDGSYIGAYLIFDSILDLLGFTSVDGSGFDVSPAVVAQEQASFALAQNLPAAVGDLNNGRVSPVDSVIVYEREGPNLFHQVAAGPASQVLTQWAGIQAFINAQAGTPAGSWTTPVGLTVPGGAGLEMTLAQLYNYLQRSQTSLYPSDINQAVVTFYVNELGRWASQADSAGWYPVLFDTGSDIALRQALAASLEALTRLTASWQNTLSRAIDAATAAWVQGDLVNGNFTQASWLSYLAYLPETAADLNAVFQNILSRSMDAATQASAQAGLANGSLTQSAWLSQVAYSAEAAADIAAIYLGDLGRAVDAASLAAIQSYLSQGGTMAAERSSVAASQEAAAAINACWLGESGVAVDPGNMAFWQQQFGAGATLAVLRNALAYSWSPTVAAINGVYESVLGRAVDAAALTAAQANFAAGGTLQQLTVATAKSQEAQADIASAFENVLGSVPTAADVATYTAILASGGNVATTVDAMISSQPFRKVISANVALTAATQPSTTVVVAAVNTLQQDVNTTAEITWASALTSVGGGVLTFLETINPISPASAANLPPSPGGPPPSVGAFNIAESEVIAQGVGCGGCGWALDVSQGMDGCTAPH